MIFKEDISNNKELIEKTIIEGGIIVYPTYTLYEIGGRADSDEVVNKIYQIKQRDNLKPLTCIVPDFDYIEEYFKVNETIRKEIYSKLPGKFTFLLEPNSKNKISKDSFKDVSKIGVRICNNFIQDIIYSLNIPIFATSANLAEETNPISFESIPSELLKKVDLIIVDDTSTSKKGSTIIEFLENKNYNIIRN